jgi:NitT/TauT family transport system ATP-binding protein
MKLNTKDQIENPVLALEHLKLLGVSKTYGEGDFAKDVVRGCSLSIPAGSLTVLIGPSGCGKSTLIRLIAGYEKPTQGEITLNGRVVDGPGVDRLVVFQESTLFPWLTTSENIGCGPMARGDNPSKVKTATSQLLDKVGLRAFHNKYPGQLSGGMQRRAELARAMINNPELMILDEPFRGLDAMSKTLMLEYFAQLFEESRRTTLFITTDIDEAIFLADRIVIMSNIPMRVQEILTVDLPRPRKLSDVVKSDRANELKSQALAVLHAEAMKSFSGGSKAAADFLHAYSKRVQSA